MAEESMMNGGGGFSLAHQYYSTSSAAPTSKGASSSAYPLLLGYSSSQEQNLLLDSNIRDWVVLPLLVIMITAGLLRHNIGQLLRTTRRPLSPVETSTKSCLQRCQRLRSGGGGFLSKHKWEARRRHFSARQDGAAAAAAAAAGGFLRTEAERIVKEKEEKSKETTAANLEDADAQNPMAMMDGVKGNMIFMVQNMVMMQGISHFFRGYVLVKVPFPLTKGFKMMFQRGLDLTTLDTSYVSSVSWYFLVMFGLRAFFRLVIGDPPQETQESMMLQHQMGVATTAANPQQKFNAEAALKSEADNLELARHLATVDDAERRVLGKRYPRKKVSAILKGNPTDDIFGYGQAKASASKSQSKKNK